MQAPEWLPIAVAVPFAAATPVSDEAASPAAAAGPSATAQRSKEPARQRRVAAPVPVDPLRPRCASTSTARRTHRSPGARRRGFAMPDSTMTSCATASAGMQPAPTTCAHDRARRRATCSTSSRSSKRRGMPTELALLPYIESAYNPQAMSSAQASGMWQFVPGTGTDFALKQNVFRDDRRDVLASTRAALDYLQKLLRDVRRLAARPRRLQLGRRQRERAIAKNQQSGRPTDYAQPAHAQRDAGLRAKTAGGQEHRLPARRFRLEVSRTLQTIRTSSACRSSTTSTSPLAIKLSGVPVEEFQFLNPQMNKPVILAAGTPQILPPYDNAEPFIHDAGRCTAGRWPPGRPGPRRTP